MKIDCCSACSSGLTAISLIFSFHIHILRAMGQSRRDFLRKASALAAYGLLQPFAGSASAQNEPRWRIQRGRTDYVFEVGNANQPLVDVNADKRIIPASMTKILTLSIAAEEVAKGNLDPEETLRLSLKARQQPAVRSGLRRVRVDDAIHLCAVRSYNDLAFGLAEAIAGTEWDFHRTHMMGMAERIGMQNSEFWNSHGLPKPGVGENLTTAQDMGRLIEYLIENHSDTFDIFGRENVTHPSWRNPLVNTNGLLEGSSSSRAVPTQGVDWGKTGYVNKAGYQIALSCERDGRRLIVISTGHSSARARNQHVHDMIDAAYDALPPKLKIVKPPPSVVGEDPFHPYRTTENCPDIICGMR